MEQKRVITFVVGPKDRNSKLVAAFKSIPWIQAFESARGFLYGAIDPRQRSKVEFMLSPVAMRSKNFTYRLSSSLPYRMQLNLDFNSLDELGLLFPKDIEFLSLLKTMPRLEDGTFCCSIVHSILFWADGARTLVLSGYMENISVSSELGQHLIILEQ